ncbi:MAG: helix-turn-helix transcriptional regulator [Eggerthellaceae bacterium]
MSRTRHDWRAEATRLSALRRDASLTQAQLAFEIGVPTSIISAMENGTVDRTAEALLEYFGPRRGIKDPLELCKRL